MKSFLFYDIETTGLNKSFDQVLQFAAIRTDTELNEKDRYDFTIRLRPDVIPSPYASITHRISIADADKGMTELSAMRHIHALLNTPGTISTGYNTLGFDDEFLRFSFYRNLLSPYTHQYAGGCSRSDILPIAVLYFLYKPDILKWPAIDGTTSLKLENIAESNDFLTGRAHDAMVDVEATLELARKFYAEKEMWSYVSGFFDKKIDNERLSRLPVSFSSSVGMHTTGLMTSIKFGADNLYQVPVLYIGNSVPYSNQSLWLRLDQSELSDFDPNDIEASSMVIRKRAGEPPVILPPLDRFLAKITRERMDIVGENLNWLKNQTKKFNSLVSYYRDYRYPEVECVDADAALYLNGFMSRQEQALCNKFHHADHDKLPDIISDFGESPVGELAERLCFRNGLLNMQDNSGNRFENYLNSICDSAKSEIPVDFRGEKKLTPALVLDDIKTIKDDRSLDGEQVELLQELEDYIQNRFVLPG